PPAGGQQREQHVRPCGEEGVLDRERVGCAVAELYHAVRDSLLRHFWPRAGGVFVFVRSERLESLRVISAEPDAARGGTADLARRGRGDDGSAGVDTGEG